MLLRSRARRARRQATLSAAAPVDDHGHMLDPSASLEDKAGSTTEEALVDDPQRWWSAG